MISSPSPGPVFSILYFMASPYHKNSRRFNKAAFKMHKNADELHIRYHYINRDI